MAGVGSAHANQLGLPQHVWPACCADAAVVDVLVTSVRTEVLHDAVHAWIERNRLQSKTLCVQCGSSCLDCLSLVARKIASDGSECCRRTTLSAAVGCSQLVSQARRGMVAVVCHAVSNPLRVVGLCGGHGRSRRLMRLCLHHLSVHGWCRLAVCCVVLLFVAGL
jgi:hypothetical protein